jgi:hypothetical protein
LFEADRLKCQLSLATIQSLMAMSLPGYEPCFPRAIDLRDKAGSICAA